MTFLRPALFCFFLTLFSSIIILHEEQYNDDAVIAKHLPTSINKITEWRLTAKLSKCDGIWFFSLVSIQKIQIKILIYATFFWPILANLCQKSTRLQTYTNCRNKPLFYCLVCHQSINQCDQKSPQLTQTKSWQNVHFLRPRQVACLFDVVTQFWRHLVNFYPCRSNLVHYISLCGGRGQMMV